MKDNKKTEDELDAALVQAVLDILRSPKSKTGERLAAIANGIKLIATRHAIVGDRDTADFFGGSGS